MALGANAGDVYLEGHYRNAPGFGREMSVAVNRPAMRAGEEASKHFGRKFAAGLAVSAAAIGYGLVKATRLAARGIQAATDKASDLNETINKTNVIFGRNAAGIQKWSRSSARDLGLSRQEALANASAFGDMFLQLKLGQPQAVKMSKGMVELSADLASFHNADITQVLEAQQAAFRGEYDSVQRFIPAINAARVEQVALAQTHKATAKELTQAEKAQAVYTIMLRDTTSAQGDFQRTSRDLANTRRIEKAQWEDIQAAMGQRFLPAQLAVHRALSTKLLPALGVLVQRYGPAVERFATRWATAFAAAIPTSTELTRGLRALSASYREGDVTSDGFVGGMERIGATAHVVVNRFHELQPALREAWAGLRDTNVQAGDLTGTLRVSGALLGFVADHAEFLARNIGLVVAAYVAFKGIQAAAQAAQVAQVALLPAQIAGNFTLARANRALAVSYKDVGVSAGAAAAGQGSAAAATTAGTVAAGGAMARWSALARTLGLFGAAAAAGAYQGNQLAEATTKGTLVSGPFAEQRAKILRGLGLEATTAAQVAAAQRGLNAATEAGTTAAGRHAGALRDERSASDAMKGALQGEKTAALDVRQAKLNVATAQERLTGLVRDGKKGSNEYRQAEIDLKRAQMDLKGRTDDFRIAQAKATAKVREARLAALNTQSAYNRFGIKALGAGKQAYTMGVKAAAGLRLIPSKKTVTIKATFGFRTPPDVSMHDIVGATGGFVTGRAIVPRRLHRGGLLDGPGTETSDSIPARLSKGEYVVNARAVRRVGRDTMDRINAQGFATGGPVLDARFPSGSVMGRVAARFEGAIDRALGRLAGKWDRYAEAQFGGTGKPAIMRYIRSLDPFPYIWGGAGPRGWDCSGIVGDVHLAHLGRPHGHGQRIYTTSSIRAGVMGLKPGLGGVLQIGVTAGTGHMAGRYGGLGFEAESSRTGIKIGGAASRPESFARRYHLARGGPIDEEFLAALAATGRFDIGGDRGKLRVNGQTFDRGGWLMPGTTVAQNNTGKPEKVVGPAEVMTVTLSARSVRDLAAAIASQPPQVHLDGRRMDKQLRNAAVWNARR